MRNSKENTSKRNKSLGKRTISIVLLGLEIYLCIVLLNGTQLYTSSGRSTGKQVDQTFSGNIDVQINRPDDTRVSSPEETKRDIQVFVPMETENSAPKATLKPAHTPVPVPSATAAPVPTTTPEPTPSPMQIPTPILTPAPQKTIAPVSDSIEKGTDYRHPVYHGDKTKPVITLTFDDGYDRKSVERALDILHEKKVYCTFFVVGEALKTHKALWKRALDEGHQICNHTNTHAYLNKLSEDEIKQEILGWEKTAEEVFGDAYIDRMKKEFPYLRLPGGAGSKTEKVLKVITQLNYTPIGWSVETYHSILRHYNLKTEPADDIAAKVADYITGNVTKGSIVLLHFNSFDTLRLGDILDGINGRGLEMKLVSEVLK